MQNVLRAINATSGKEAGTYVIQPLRYQGRQDKRNGLDESLDLAIGLNNLNNNCRNLRRVITVDAHNHAAFQNCLPQINCINAHPTVPILQEVIDKIPEELHNILII
jgi:phosphoribosylpyrophosphate synthetase